MYVQPTIDELARLVLDATQDDIAASLLDSLTGQGARRYAAALRQYQQVNELIDSHLAHLTGLCPITDLPVLREEQPATNICPHCGLVNVGNWTTMYALLNVRKMRLRRFYDAAGELGAQVHKFVGGVIKSCRGCMDARAGHESDHGR